MRQRELQSVCSVWAEGHDAVLRVESNGQEVEAIWKWEMEATAMRCDIQVTQNGISGHGMAKRHAWSRVRAMANQTYVCL